LAPAGYATKAKETSCNSNIDDICLADCQELMDHGRYAPFPAINHPDQAKAQQQALYLTRE
jgi:hypothetical protein